MITPVVSRVVSPVVSRVGRQFSPLALEYFALVKAGGGEVLDENFTNDLLVEMDGLGVYDSARCIVGARLGNTLRIDGSDTFSSKTWDASTLKGHYTQSTEAEQPRLVDGKWVALDEETRLLVGDANALKCLRAAAGATVMVVSDMTDAGLEMPFHISNNSANTRPRIGFRRASAGDGAGIGYSINTADDDSVLTNSNRFAFGPPVSPNGNRIYATRYDGTTARALEFKSQVGSTTDFSGPFPDTDSDECTIMAMRAQGTAALNPGDVKLVLVFNADIGESNHQALVDFILAKYPDLDA